MKIKFFQSLLVIILFLVFVIFYKSLQKPNIYTPNIGIKKVVPSFEATIFDTNEKIDSKEIFKNDNFYLINIWASWCLPCRSEHPYLMKFKNEKSLKLIGINYKDKKENASQFLKEFRNPFDKILTDEDGTISIVLGAYGVPETFLVKNNKIVKKIIGPIDQKKYLDTLKLINE